MAANDDTLIEARVPPRLLEEMQALVRAGWYRDLDDLMTNALRRHLEVHRPELMERFVRDDVAWGLHGRD